jgi:hypothetical protein
MTINQGIPDYRLLEDLLSESTGDEMTNRVRSLIREKFDVEFAKLPYNLGSNEAIHEESCIAISQNLVENLSPFVVGNVPADGTMVIQLINEVHRVGIFTAQGSEI